MDGRGRPTCGPSRPRSGIIPTAHGSGLFQRGETQVLNVADPRHAEDGPDARHRRARAPRSATCTTTTCRPTPTARPAAWVAPSAARSATACSPSGPCCPSSRRMEEFPYALRLVSEVLSSNGSTSMALGLLVVAVADGRRRADQGARRRHRHGPHLRGRQVRHPHRHPRCRGRLRRHGLQGRRHVRVRHRPAARHQDRRPPGRGPGRGPAAGQGGPPRDPRGHERRHRRAPRPTWAPRPRRSSASRSRSTRSARSSARRARSSTPSSRRPAPTSPSTTTAWSARSPSAPRTARPSAEARRRIELILDPPKAEVGADLHRRGRQHHQVRCVRQHPPGP